MGKGKNEERRPKKLSDYTRIGMDEIDLLSVLYWNHSLQKSIYTHITHDVLYYSTSRGINYGFDNFKY